MKRRICLYGGPGCGKSSVAAGLFYQLKIKGYNIELVNEYIKDWAYEKRIPKSFQQVYIFAKQLNKEDLLFPNVDIIITDSPVILNTVYSKKNGFKGWELLVNMGLLYEEQFPGLHIFLDRDDIAYKAEGRYHNYDESIEMDNLILEMLNKYLKYKVIPSKNFDEILNYVLKNIDE